MRVKKRVELSKKEEWEVKEGIIIKKVKKRRRVVKGDALGFSGCM